MKFVRFFLSHTFYVLGDRISKLNAIASRSHFWDSVLYHIGTYDLYQIFMRWSVDLDKAGEVWEFVENDKD